MRSSIRRSCFWAAVFVVIAAVGFGGSADAQTPSGRVVKVNPLINATGPGGERLIELEGAVFMGDEIVAGPVGLAQIKFIDDTRLVVGPNSRLTIDKFVFNPDNTAQEVSINMIKGTFRFISGRSRDEAYTLRTPTMTAGIRG